jgi:hypothetical protein
MKTGSNLAESSKKDYGSKGAVLPVVIRIDAKYKCRRMLYFSFFAFSSYTSMKLMANKSDSIEMQSAVLTGDAESNTTTLKKGVQTFS